MKKSRFSKAKIISVLKRNERGEKVRDLCRQIGISDPEFISQRLDTRCKDRKITLA